MPLEVEVKVRISQEQAQKVQEFLVQEASIQKQGEVTETDYYFNHPCRDFSETDEALRIRESKQETTITYKGKKLFAETKTREEIIVPIEQPERATQLLIALGFQKVAVVFKTRQVFKAKELIITMDNVPKLGIFMEFELHSSREQSPEKLDQELRERVNHFFKNLNLQLPSFISKSYLELLLEKKIDNNMPSSS